MGVLALFGVACLVIVLMGIGGLVMYIRNHWKRP